jgi:hypothetical protein
MVSHVKADGHCFIGKFFAVPICALAYCACYVSAASMTQARQSVELLEQIRAEPPFSHPFDVLPCNMCDLQSGFPS